MHHFRRCIESTNLGSCIESSLQLLYFFFEGSDDRGVVFGVLSQLVGEDVEKIPKPQDVRVGCAG